MKPNRLLATGEVYILDGGLATALEAKGLDLSSALWSARILQDNPQAIYDVHREYFEAGGQIATTASYQASTSGLHDHLGLDDDGADNLIRKSAQLACDARDEIHDKDNNRVLLIAGSVGPYGAYLSNGAEYTGDYSLSDKEMRDFHRGRIRALVDGGVDLLALETMPSISEIESLLGLLKDEFPKVEAWLSCTLRDAEHLSDGTPVIRMVNLANDNDQITAVGYNCIPQQLASAALDHVRPLTTKPLVIYPNSGEQWNAKDREWHGDKATGQTLKELTQEWYAKGARLIGGCCRTDAADIKEISNTLKP